jgi:hypothetical protein
MSRYFPRVAAGRGARGAYGGHARMLGRACMCTCRAKCVQGVSLWGGGVGHSSSYQVDNALLPQRRTAAVLWMILMQRAAYERLLDLSQQLRALGCLAPLAPLLRLARLTH